MIKIMADSTCDLSDEVLEMYDISLASLTINAKANYDYEGWKRSHSWKGKRAEKST